ncbi:MAG TPA: DinB family protein [Dehalococcoidia bacterium]|jgi:hypothetical protein|nr:DinB family protein [Dehalococcoidia bacterium]
MTNQLTEEQERVRGYLLSQSERYDWVDLWARVISARIDLMAEFDRVSDQQAAFSASDEEWSIGEVLHHALNGARGTAVLIESLAKGEEPPERQRVDPAREPAEASFAQQRRELAEESVQFAALVARLPEPPSLELTQPHMFFGDLHSKAWFLFQRVHDQDHMGQVQQIKAAAGYPES